MANKKNAPQPTTHQPVHETNAAARQSGKADPKNNPALHYMNNQQGIQETAADCHRRGRL